MKVNRRKSPHSCTIKIPRIIPATTPTEKIKSISFIGCAFSKLFVYLVELSILEQRIDAMARDGFQKAKRMPRGKIRESNVASSVTFPAIGSCWAELSSIAPLAVQSDKQWRPGSGS